MSSEGPWKVGKHHQLIQHKNLEGDFLSEPNVRARERLLLEPEFYMLKVIRARETGNSQESKLSFSWNFSGDGETKEKHRLGP